MDFFSQQESARKRSRSLLWRFVLANLLLAGLLSFGLLALGSTTSETEHQRRASQGRPESGGMIPAILVLDCFMMLTVTGAALVKFHSLSSSGGAVAEALGGKKVSPETDELLERRFVNVVEEMAIAANTPVPEMYILDDEEGINAFASGPSPEHSAVAVTRGALQRLSRDELQGVVAHEFSHILHGDVRLNIRLAGYIYGLVILSAIGRFVLRLASDSSSRRSSKDRGGGAAVIAVIGIFFLLFGLLGRLVSVIMSAAISREREYLADATAVQLTRNPDGIAGALKKIGGFSKGATIGSSSAEGLSHFFLAEGKTAGFFERLYASHPPLLERIKRIDPNFDGKLPDDESIGLQVGDEVEGVSKFASSSRPEAPASRSASPAEELVATMPLHSEWMPPASVRAAVVGLGSAEAVVSCVLLSEEPGTRQKQMKLLAGWIAPDEVLRREADVRNISLSQQVSAVFMALPTIQLGSRERRAAFRMAVVDMARADGSVSLLEFLVSVLVYFGTEETDESFTLRGGSSRSGLSRFPGATGNVLSVCALFAAAEGEPRRKLFDEAAQRLKLKIQFDERADSDIPVFLKSLESLRSTSPAARGRVIAALREMVLSDGIVTELELSLLRLLAVLLRTELPDVSVTAQEVGGRVQGV